MQQTWEWQQPSYVSAVQPAPLPTHAWDAWQSEGQGNQTHNCAEGHVQHNIYPPGSYVATSACQSSACQPAGYCNADSTSGTPQDAWHTDVHEAGTYNTTAYPEQAAAHLPNTIVSSEGYTQAAAYSKFTYQTAYQQDAWHATYANADGTHHIQGAPEQNLYYAGGAAGANVVQASGYPIADHPYLDPLEQQRQIEHAQYLISRWGASDETPAEECPIFETQSTFPAGGAAAASAVAVHPSAQASPYQVVDPHLTPGITTEGVQNAWGFGTGGVPQQCRWPYAALATQRPVSGTSTSVTRASVREHGSQTPAPAAAAAAAAGLQDPTQAESGKRAAAPRWTPTEFLPEAQKSMELSPPAAAAAM